MPRRRLFIWCERDYFFPHKPRKHLFARHERYYFSEYASKNFVIFCIYVFRIYLENIAQTRIFSEYASKKAVRLPRTRIFFPRIFLAIPTLNH